MAPQYVLFATPEEVPDANGAVVTGGDELGVGRIEAAGEKFRINHHGNRRGGRRDGNRPGGGCHETAAVRKFMNAGGEEPPLGRTDAGYYLPCYLTTSCGRI